MIALPNRWTVGLLLDPTLLTKLEVFIAMFGHVAPVCSVQC